MVSDTWKSELLGNVATLQRGFDLPHRSRKPGKVPIVTSSGIEDTHCEAKVKGPGVVTGRYGTIGEVYFVRDDFWPHNTTLYVRDFHGNDPLFISYLLRTIDFHMHSGKTGVPGVNRNDLHEIIVTLPSTKTEQRAIAEALSDADAFIETVEQLLAKKRQVKQGAMQELLTGKRRLPGYSKKWETKRLGELGKFYKGKGLPKDVLSDDGKFPAIPYTAIYTDFKEVFDISFVKNYTSSSDTVFIDAPHVLIAGSSNMLENVGKVCSYNDNKPVAIGGDVIIYKTVVDVRFISYLLNTLQHRKKIVFLSQGSTIRHVYISTFMQYEIQIPELVEQTAIAEILSDMDAEIATLEGKLSKARQVKVGMMSVLLTGRIRLVES